VPPLRRRDGVRALPGHADPLLLVEVLNCGEIVDPVVSKNREPARGARRRRWANDGESR